LNHWSWVDLDNILSHTSIYVTVPDGEDLEIGYDIIDSDESILIPDYPVCGGSLTLQHDLLDEPRGVLIESDNRRCSVSFQIRLSP
jgi:hypothetical protein